MGLPKGERPRPSCSRSPLASITQRTTAGEAGAGRNFKFRHRVGPCGVKCSGVFGDVFRYCERGGLDPLNHAPSQLVRAVGAMVRAIKLAQIGVVLKKLDRGAGAYASYNFLLMAFRSIKATFSSCATADCSGIFAQAVDDRVALKRVTVH